MELAGWGGDDNYDVVVRQGLASLAWVVVNIIR